MLFSICIFRFVSAEGMVARLIVSTNETFSFILPYNTERKWKRSRDDLYNPYTTQGLLIL